MGTKVYLKYLACGNGWNSWGSDLLSDGMVVVLGKVMSGGSADPGNLVINFNWYVVFLAFWQMVLEMI